VISPQLLSVEGRGRPLKLLPLALEPPPDNAFFPTLLRDGRRDAREWIRASEFNMRVEAVMRGDSRK